MSQIYIDPTTALSLPLDITNPLEITGATEDAVMVGTAAGTLTALPLGQDGEVIIGDTGGGTPGWSTLTAGTNINITNAAQSITINAAGSGIGPEFADNVFRVFANGDPTSKISLNCAQIASGTTRILALADRNINMNEVATTFVSDAGNGVPVLGSLGILGNGAISTSGAGGTITISSTTLVWNEVLAIAQAAAVNNGYITNNAARVTVTLPAVAAVGDIIEMVGKGAGGWQLAQNIGQTIFFGDSSTTTGPIGFLRSSQRYDAISIVCTTANNDFVVKSSVGNIIHN